MMFLSVCIAMLAVGERGPRAEVLRPADTHAVIAGVLEWSDPNLSSFPSENRKDQELFDLLGKSGVPIAQRRLLIDGAATTDAIMKALKKAVAAAKGKDATLVFYYAGHGIKDPTGEIVFASSDVSTARSEHTGLHLDDLVPVLAGFKGRRIVLLADCCYSGGLVAVAEALAARGLDVVALTSAEASNLSTGNWTFTQTVIDAFSGKPIGDRDGDGNVELGELASEVADAMKHREQQRSAFFAADVPAELVLAESANDDDFGGRRDWVQTPHNGGLAPARVIAEKGDKLHVAFYDYSDETRAWVAANDTAPFDFRTWQVGTALTIGWKNVPYAAKVIAVDNGFMKVTYPGWDAKWDEWITSARVLAGPEDKQIETAKTLQVEWKGSWYPAVKTGMKGELTCIHYVGYEDSWDECVEPARVR